MFSKTTFFVAFVAIAQLSVAAVPGCLLGAINTFNAPGEIKTVCESKDAPAKIQDFCKGTAPDALKAFAETCKSAGVTVSTDVQSDSPSPSGGTKPSGSNAPTPTGTAGNTNNQNNQVGTPVNSATAADATGAAGKLEIGAAALFAGLLAAAL